MIQLSKVTGYIMFTTVQGFFARISDPRFGGIYMTLLLSMANIGFYWISTVCLWLVDPLTVKSCKTPEAEKLKVLIILNTTVILLFRGFHSTKYVYYFFVKGPGQII